MARFGAFAGGCLFAPCEGQVTVGSESQPCASSSRPNGPAPHLRRGSDKADAGVARRSRGERRSDCTGQRVVAVVDLGGLLSRARARARNAAHVPPERALERIGAARTAGWRASATELPCLEVVVVVVESRAAATSGGSRRGLSPQMIVVIDGQHAAPTAAGWPIRSGRLGP
jgi:hypothetical protein